MDANGLKYAFNLWYLLFNRYLFVLSSNELTFLC